MQNKTGEGKNSPLCNKPRDAWNSGDRQHELLPKNRCSIVSESHCKQCTGCKQAKHADKHGGGGKLNSARTCLDEACREIFKSQNLRAISEDLIILILILIINNVCNYDPEGQKTPPQGGGRVLARNSYQGSPDGIPGGVSWYLNSSNVQ